MCKMRPFFNILYSKQYKVNFVTMEYRYNHFMFYGEAILNISFLNNSWMPRLLGNKNLYHEKFVICQEPNHSMSNIQHRLNIKHHEEFSVSVLLWSFFVQRIFSFWINISLVLTGDKIEYINNMYYQSYQELI